MPSNPLTQEEVNSYSINRILNPEGYTGLSPYMPAGYFLSTPPSVSGPALWRLFDASFISSGIIDRNRLGTGSTGAGNLYLADDGTWKAVSGGGGGGDMFKSTYDVDNSGVVDNAESISIVGRNSTGSTLYKGTVVYISGSTGNLPNFVKAQANVEATSAGTFGVVRADISNNSNGYVTTIGFLDNLDTRSTATHPFTDVTLADGDTVYLHPTIAGYITNVKPSAPNHLVYVGKVTRTSPTNGTIVYRIQNGYELDEIHDVAISSKANNDLLTYESSTSLWKNKTFAAIFGGTPLVSVPTLDQVTTAGNTTTNAITVGGLTINNNTINSQISVESNRPTGASNFVSANFRNTNATSNKVQFTLGGGTIASGESRTFSFGTDVTGAGVKDFYIYNGGTLNATLLITPNDNIRIGYTGTTYTDAGFRLDVNGSARISGNVTLQEDLLLNAITGSVRTIEFKNVGGGLYPSVGGAARIKGEYGDFYWQAAGGSAMQLGAYHEIVLQGGRNVSTNLSFITGSSAAYNVRVLNTNASSVALAIQGVTSQTGDLLRIDSTTATSNGSTFVVKSNGNILINTTTDAGYKLDVNGTARIKGALRATLANVTTSNVVYYDSSTGLMTYGAAPSGGGGGTLDTVTTSGNTTTNSISVGGLTVANGAAPIAVFNSSNGGGTYLAIQYNGVLKAGWGMGGNIASAANSVNDVGFWSSNDMFWETNGSSRMSLNSSGRLLMNTITDTGEILQVNGTIKANSFTSSGGTGFSGTFTVPTNPPGQQNLNISGGIIISVT